MLLLYFAFLYANGMHMKQEYFVSFYLDTRRKKRNGLYPVKLRVYTSSPRKQKLYPTPYEMTSTEFDEVMDMSNTDNSKQDLRSELNDQLKRAREEAKKIVPFSFEKFEEKLSKKQGDALKVKYQYEERIRELIQSKQIGTANTYELGMKSLKVYHEMKFKTKFENLTFDLISKKWLEGYEAFMIDELERSATTVSIYVRTLRTLFNKVIEEKELDREFYPFGNKRYEVPSSKNVKKALNKEQLTMLYNAETSSVEQQKAKDFWFFSFACNGMNIKDIANLKYKNIDEDVLTFYRSKTKKTAKKDSKPIEVELMKFEKGIIEKYGNERKSNNTYIFDIIDERMDEFEKMNSVKNFTRYINQHMKKLCMSNELNFDISTYTARHSYASNLVASGASIVETMESLGHRNIQTTQNYLTSLKGVELSKKKASVTDFMNR